MICEYYISTARLLKSVATLQSLAMPVENSNKKFPVGNLTLKFQDSRVTGHTTLFLFGQIKIQIGWQTKVVQLLAAFVYLVLYSMNLV